MAERGKRALRHLIDFAPTGDIDFEGQCPATFALDFCRHLAGALLVEVRANDIGALARENQRCRAADAARGAGDEDGFSGKIVWSFRHGDAFRSRPRLCTGTPLPQGPQWD
jgi:hypothetical protein